MPLPTVTLTFDLLTLYAIDVRPQTDVRQHHRLMPPPRGWGIIICV